MPAWGTEMAHAVEQSQNIYIYILSELLMKLLRIEISDLPLGILRSLSLLFFSIFIFVFLYVGLIFKQAVTT